MNNLKTLGSTSAKLINSLYQINRTIFTLKDVERITGLKSTSARNLTSVLVKRQIISRIKLGKFIIIPQEIGINEKYIGNWYLLAREIVKSPDYYISYYSAMDIHNMLTQPITKVYIATPLQERHKHKTIGNVSFEFIYTSKKNIWGIKNHWVTNSEQVRVSDIEKTILDCLSNPKYCGGILEIAKGILIQKDGIDFAKLINHCLDFNKIAVTKRLGYILETLKLQNSNALSKLHKTINNKYYVLDPLIDTTNTFKNSWKLIANINPEDIINSGST